MPHKSQITAVTSFPAVVGAVLAALRKASDKEITQSDLAAAIGATVSTWSRIETGETALTIEQLKQAADKLGMPPSAILFIAETKVAELQQKGVVTEPKRIPVEYAVSRGAVPILGAALVGLIGPVLGPASGAVAAVAVTTAAVLKKKGR